MNCEHYNGNNYCNLHKQYVASAYCGDICEYKFVPISRNMLLKAPITVVYSKDNYSIYSYDQTLKEIEDEDMECEAINYIENNNFIYKKLTENWFRKPQNNCQ